MTQPAARAHIRAQAPDSAPEDLLLLDDLLGIADPDVELPKIDPDARRRRLTTLVNAASLARQTPAVFVVEDAHWIDEVSESLFADFLTVMSQTPSLVLVTYRPEYQGALTRVAGAQTVGLAPLSDSETAGLVSELIGPDPSNGALRQRIAERAAGNPFFAEEIVRELAGRGVLRGEPGAYHSAAQVGEVSVPVTLQATIAARIDRLDPLAKRTLSAAAVLGARFDLDLLAALGVEQLNMAGVIPPIFASSLLVFPATIAQFFGNSPNPNVIQRTLQKIAAILNYGQPLHVLLFALLIIGFAFFYVALVYDARDTAENLKKAGAFIPGIRPGQQTGDYLDKVLTRLDFVGRPVHHGRVSAARNNSHGESEHSVPVRWHVVVDHRRRCNGFRRANAVAFDVASI